MIISIRKNVTDFLYGRWNLEFSELAEEPSTSLREKLERYPFLWLLLQLRNI